MNSQKLSLKEAVSLVSTVAAGENLAETNGYFPIKNVLYYAATEVNSKGLINPSQVAEPGITNFDQGRVINPFFVTGMRLRIDTTTGAGVTAKTANYKDGIPAVIENGEIQFTQGNEILTIPVSALANNNAATSNEDDFIDSGFLLMPNNVVAARDFFTGAFPSNTAYRLELLGYELRPNKRK